MSVRRRLRLLALVTVLCTGAAGLPACAPDADGRQAGPTATCAELAEQYGSFPAGTSVTVATPFTGVEAERFDASVADFSRCTGVTIVQNGSDELENQLRAELGGATDLADLAVVPQPGLVTDLARHGRIVALPESVGANTELGWDRIWSDAGRVDGELYGAPLMASVKSFVWYSPVAFERAGYQVPTTWDELVALTDKVVADHPDGSVTPWCLGASDGATTGWPVSDWLEDGLLAIHGTGAYDQWANHDIPVDAQVAVSTLDRLDSLLLAKGHVAGGRAGVVSMTMEEAGAELVSGTCLMLHASSSFETVLPPGTTVTDADGAHGVTVSASPTEAASTPAGQPDEAGEPTPAGQPDDAGQSNGAGEPGEAGQPDEAGRSDDAGEPDDVGQPTPAGDPDNAGWAPSEGTPSEGTPSEGAASGAYTGAPASTATATPTPVRTGGVVSAFLLPAIETDSTSNPVLVGGDYLVALKVSDASTAVMSYLTSSVWAQTRLSLGGVASANHGVDAAGASSPVAQEASRILQSRQSVVRIDASDMMPSAVGTQVMWGALTKWARGETSSVAALATAEAAWPKKG